MSDALSLHFLGTGTLVPDPQRSTSATLVEWNGHRILIDCGFGTLRRLAEADIDPRRIDGILLTHFHPDHVGDLVNLFFTLAHLNDRREEPLQIAAHPHLGDYLDRQVAANGEWLERFRDRSLLHVDATQSPFPFLSLRIDTRPMRHTPYSIGYRLCIGEERVAFSGDTGACEALNALCRDCDLVVIECALSDDDEPDTHLNPRAVGRMAHEANVRTVCVTHLYPETRRLDPLERIRREFDGSVILVQDGQRLTLRSGELGPG